MKEPDNRVDRQASSQCLSPSQPISRTTVFDDHWPPVAVLIPRRFNSTAICRADDGPAPTELVASAPPARRPAPPDRPTMLAPNRQVPPVDSSEEEFSGMELWMRGTSKHAIAKGGQVAHLLAQPAVPLGLDQRARNFVAEHDALRVQLNVEAGSVCGWCLRQSAAWPR
jgi:hypothetical protein